MCVLTKQTFNLYDLFLIFYVNDCMIGGRANLTNFNGFLFQYYKHHEIPNYFIIPVCSLTSTATAAE